MPDVFSRIEKIASSHKHDYPVSLENILLCAHAYLSKRQHIPRMCLKSNNLSDVYWFNAYINQCLYVNTGAVEQWTLANLKLVNLPIKEMGQVNPFLRQEYINFVSEKLDIITGDSIIYYENARITPFAENDITHYLNFPNISLDENQIFVLEKLFVRARQRTEYQKKHQNITQALNLYGKTDMYHEVCKFKSEELWQQHWRDERKYQTPNIIDSILITGDFDD